MSIRRRHPTSITQVIPCAPMAEEIAVSRTSSRSRERPAAEVLRDFLRAEGLVLARAADTSWALDEGREGEALAAMAAAMGAP